MLAFFDINRQKNIKGMKIKIFRKKNICTNKKQQTKDADLLLFMSGMSEVYFYGMSMLPDFTTVDVPESNL